MCQLLRPSKHIHIDTNWKEIQRPVCAHVAVTDIYMWCDLKSCVTEMSTSSADSVQWERKFFFLSKGDIPPLIAVSFVKMSWMLHFLPLLNLDNTSQTILTAIMYFTWKWFPKLVPKVKKFRSVNLLKMDYITYVSWKTLDGCHNL